MFHLGPTGPLEAEPFLILGRRQNLGLSQRLEDSFYVKTGKKKTFHFFVRIVANASNYSQNRKQKENL